MLDMATDIVNTISDSRDSENTPVNVVYRVNKMQLTPILMPPKLKFPLYYISGNGMDMWEIDILFGKGQVRTIKRFLDKNIAQYIANKETRVKAVVLYENLRKAALKELNRLNEEEPLK